MGEQPTGIELLDAAWREPVRRLCARLEELWGAHLLAVAVYGAAIDGRQPPVQGLLRSVMVLDGIDLSVLRRLAEDGPRFATLGLARPLVFTPEDLNDSCDTFPLELIEIQQQHVTVFGSEYFETLSFADADVRLQCERELKVVLIGMQQGLLASSGQEQALLEVARPLLEHLTRTLRGLLWSQARRETVSADKVLGATEELLDRPFPGLRRLLEASDCTTWEDFCEAYADVRDLGQYVDAD